MMVIGSLQLRHLSVHAASTSRKQRLGEGTHGLRGFGGAGDGGKGSEEAGEMRSVGER